MGALMQLIILGSVFFIYYDASKHKIGKIPDEKGFFNLSAGGWMVVTLFLWIVAFPAYLIKRSVLIEKAKVKPQEPSMKNLKLGFIGACFGFALIGTLSQNEIINFSPIHQMNKKTEFKIETNLDKAADWIYYELNLNKVKDALNEDLMKRDSNIIAEKIDLLNAIKWLLIDSQDPDMLDSDYLTPIGTEPEYLNYNVESLINELSKEFEDTDLKNSYLAKVFKLSTYILEKKMAKVTTEQFYNDRG